MKRLSSLFVLLTFVLARKEVYITEEDKCAEENYEAYGNVQCGCKGGTVYYGTYDSIMNDEPQVMSERRSDSTINCSKWVFGKILPDEVQKSCYCEEDSKREKESVQKQFKIGLVR